MKNIRRSFRDLLAATFAAGAVISCDDATRPKLDGEVVPHIVNAELRPHILARLTTPDAMVAQLNGPTPRTVPLVLNGGFYEGRANGLTEGPYDDHHRDGEQ
jgi:hypothetical protein